MGIPNKIINILVRNINERLNNRNISEWLNKIGLINIRCFARINKKKDITNITYDDIKDITEKELTDAGLDIPG